MQRTYETQMPAPGIDIVRTPHVRTFAPGSGGGHLDTLLQNQITLLRQNQDIRTQLALLLDDKAATSSAAGPKRWGKSPVLKLAVGQGLVGAAARASRAYHRGWGDGAMKLRRTKRIAFPIRKWRTALMDDRLVSEGQKFELEGLAEQHVRALYFYCAAEVRGRLEGEDRMGNGV